MVVRAPGWTGSSELSGTAVDLFTPAVVPAHPAALALALLLERLQQAAPVRAAFATLLQPASEFGRAALDELHQQTVSLLSFQGLPRELYDTQAAYNLLAGLGEAAKISLGAVEARMRRHYAALSPGRWPALALQVIHAPVFHGHTFSIAIELERPVEIAALEEALSGGHVELVLEETDSPSNLAATGQNDVLVRLRPELERAMPARGLAAVAVGRLGQSAPAGAECRRVRAGPAAAAAAGNGAVGDFGLNSFNLCYTLTSRFDWSIIMQTIQASEAKTHFLRILDDVERGESVIVTRHGKRVARLIPEVEIDRERVQRAIDGILEIRKRTKPVSLEEILAMRDEGRM